MDGAEKLEEDGLLRSRFAMFVLQLAVSHSLHLVALRRDLMCHILRLILVLKTITAFSQGIKSSHDQLYVNPNASIL